MYQGPIGLLQATGRICTNISYSYRSTEHNEPLPESEPASNQVLYTPQVSDLPVFSGHPVYVQGNEAYKDLWYNCRMVTIKNLGSVSKSVTIAYKTSPTYYGSTFVTSNPGTIMSWITLDGLANPGLGVQESLMLYCPGGSGLVSLVKSYFAVVPYQIIRGTAANDVFNLRVISSQASLFGETGGGSSSLGVTMHSGVGSAVYNTYSNNEEFLSSKLSGNAYYAITIQKPQTQRMVSSNLNVVSHVQFRYPTSILYNYNYSWR